MTREKLQKLISAIVVGATVLFVFLLFVLVFQWVTMAVQNKRMADLDAKNVALQDTIDKNTIDVAWYEGPGKYWLAIEKGWIENPGE